MRKYKQVKEKKVTYSMPEWEVVERRASTLGMKTGTYIKRISVDGAVSFYDLKEAAPIVNGMRTISNNINQIARKANETHSIYADDIKVMQNQISELAHLMHTMFDSLRATNL